MSVRKLLKVSMAAGLMLWANITLHADELSVVTIQPVIRLLAEPARDQDDLCVWVDPQDAQRSIVITSDKKAERLLIYDLKGNLLQEIPVDKPGNIDLRQGVMLGGRERSVVTHTIRSNGFRLQAYEVNPQTRKLERIDAGISTIPNYGGCLYHSPLSKRLYFITTSEETVVGQYELAMNSAGKLTGQLVREWSIGKCEGAVADDAAQMLYLGEESKGIWKVGAEPDAATPGKLMVEVGQHGIHGDVEGLAIMPTGKESGYLIVSDQGRNQYHVFDRAGENLHRGVFSLTGVQETDGIEAIPGDFGSSYPAGLFGCHADGDRCAIVLTSWKSIADALKLQD